ncbi:OLC1v1019230C1 [Oldenlandia corymbosa var. corymbosa]|uniref:OLC1v1019230C1 n=1 Tax=Oldenlandia corymbosa var. corymbosa TaxID=529605 RepID=A0AAV1EDV5_OLDCO|nr:OLC1v1019230C1 [Oldenlandia corymbosa var. corymbosa]
MESFGADLNRDTELQAGKQHFECRDAEGKCYQLIMGLNECYDSLRNEILRMNPLPDVDTIYVMLLKEETQRKVSTNLMVKPENVALFSKPYATPSHQGGLLQSYGTPGGYQGGSMPNSSGSQAQTGQSSKQIMTKKMKMLAKKERMKLFCTHCKKPGHLKEDCFLIKGFPDWWGTQKGPNRANAHSANVVYTPLESENPKSASNSWQIQKPEITQNWLVSFTARGIQMSEYGKGNWQNLLSSLMQVEVGKLLKGKGSTGEAGSGFFVNYAHFNDFSSSSVALYLSSNVIGLSSLVWVTDTGATSHMCCSIQALTNIQSVSSYTLVFLPDGSVKAVEDIGDVILSGNITLKSVLHVPTFQHNLLSVRKLSQTGTYFQFFDDFCLLQDLRTNKVLRAGTIIKELYILTPYSFTEEVIQKSQIMYSKLVLLASRTVNQFTCNPVLHSENKISVNDQQHDVHSVTGDTHPVSMDVHPVQDQQHDVHSVTGDVHPVIIAKIPDSNILTLMTISVAYALSITIIAPLARGHLSLVKETAIIAVMKLQNSPLCQSVPTGIAGIFKPPPTYCSLEGEAIILPPQLFKGGPSVAVHTFSNPPTIECLVLEEFTAQLNEADSLRLLPLWEALSGALAKMSSPADIASFPGDVPAILAKGPSEKDPIPDVPDEYMGIELEDADEATEEDVADTGHSGVQRTIEDASQDPSKDPPPGSDADSWSVNRVHLMVLSEEQSSEFPLHSMTSGILRSRVDVHSIETVANLENDLLDAMRTHNVKVNQHLINEIKGLREEMQRREVQSLKDYSDSLTFEAKIHDELVTLEKENARLRARQQITVPPWFLEKHQVLARVQNSPLYCGSGYTEREGSWDQASYKLYCQTTKSNYWTTTLTSRLLSVRRK